MKKNKIKFNYFLIVSIFILSFFVFVNISKADWGLYDHSVQSSVSFESVGTASFVVQDLGDGFSGILTSIQIYGGTNQCLTYDYNQKIIELYYSTSSDYTNLHFLEYCYRDGNIDSYYSLRNYSCEEYLMDESFYYNFRVYNGLDSACAYPNPYSMYWGSASSSEEINVDRSVATNALDNKFDLRNIYFNLVGVSGRKIDNQVSSSTYLMDGLAVGKPTECCEGGECLFPIQVGSNMQDTTFQWKVDAEYCGFYQEGFSSINLDYFNGENSNLIASSSISKGSHTLCTLWYNNASSSASIQSFDVFSSTSPQCIADTIFHEQASTTPANRACTQEEWDTPDPEIFSVSIPFFNLYKWKCEILTAVYSISDIPKNVIDGSANIAKSIFPFNIPVNIYNQFISSKTAPIPSYLSFLNIADGSGDIYLTIPAGLSGSSSSTSVAVFGKTVFTQNSSSSVFFAGVRSFSTFLLWVLFLFNIQRIGYNIYDEINPSHKKEDD